LIFLTKTDLFTFPNAKLISFEVTGESVVKNSYDPCNVRISKHTSALVIFASSLFSPNVTISVRF